MSLNLPNPNNKKSTHEHLHVSQLPNALKVDSYTTTPNCTFDEVSDDKKMNEQFVNDLPDGFAVEMFDDNTEEFKKAFEQCGKEEVLPLLVDCFRERNFNVEGRIRSLCEEHAIDRPVDEALNVLIFYHAALWDHVGSSRTFVGKGNPFGCLWKSIKYVLKHVVLGTTVVLMHHAFDSHHFSFSPPEEALDCLILADEIATTTSRSLLVIQKMLSGTNRATLTISQEHMSMLSRLYPDHPLILSNFHFFGVRTTSKDISNKDGCFDRMRDTNYNSMRPTVDTEVSSFLRKKFLMFGNGGCYFLVDVIVKLIQMDITIQKKRKKKYFLN